MEKDAGCARAKGMRGERDIWIYVTGGINYIKKAVSDRRCEKVEGEDVEQSCATVSVHAFV